MEEEYYTENGESDTQSDDSNDSEYDPTSDILEKTQANFSKLSIKKKSKAPVAKDLDLGSGIDPDEVEVDIPELDEKDEKVFKSVQKIIEAGQPEKLKVDQCKVYLRKYGLRLGGSKAILIQRIKEHQEIMNGDGEKKYPVSSFVMNCKGDACTGDVVMFEQNVYEMFSIASRSASGPPCGTRTVAGRIVKESYGAAKQQHTFTIEVLWSKGEKALPPLYPLLIKGRNLYRFNTLRQRWEDEGERQKLLNDKHSRGAMARSEREDRIQKKEMRKMLKSARALGKEDPKNAMHKPVVLTASTILVSHDYQGTSKKIDIPNGRVGTIIGKSGETIKYLQLQSGAKIQVTRDTDVHPGSLTRTVDLMGTPEQIAKAEQLINDFLSQAESGGSGIVSQRITGQIGVERFVMKVPNNKVGLIIGKGGETIKSMRSTTGAHIQVIPLHLPPGDTSTERMLQIDGTTEQIELAKQMVTAVIGENRNPAIARGYSQQGYQARPMMQQPGYGYGKPNIYI